MNKTEYMNTLRQELDGLPAEVVEDTMWAYEGRFVDGMVAGREEAAIAAALPAPHIVAAQKRASLRYQELKKNANPTNLASLLVALIGLSVFNLFMIIPAILYSLILFATYVSSLAFYFVGIVITATVLSGVPQIHVSLPNHHHYRMTDSDFDDDIYRHRGNVKVDISASGISVDHEDDESATVSAASKAVTSTAASKAIGNDASKAASNVVTSSASNNAVSNTATVISETDKVLVDNSDIHVSIGNHLRSIHILNGLAFLLGGIALFMFSLFMTKYTFIGFRNYLRWNVSLLRSTTVA